MKSIRTINKICIALNCIVVFTSCNQKEAADVRPNIIYSMADDMGYADLSSYGRTDYETPVLDRFIEEGMKFTQAYAAAAVCTPSRVALMTGRYPARNEIGLKEPLDEFDDKDLGLSAELPTISSMIKDAGYETALFGKWDLGSIQESLPNAHGFDYFFGITGGAADYIDHKSINDLQILYENNQPVEEDGYLTDLITNHTIEFIKKKHERPFFISLQFNAPHWPWQLPGGNPHPLDKTWKGFQEGGSQKVFAGMMENLDINMGKLLAAIEKAGLSKNTIIIFTSDNGGDQFSDMGIFKGKKLTLYEGGIRVPAAVRWPGVIARGVLSEQPVITMDWTATILKIAGAEIPADLTLDGMDLSAHLKGEISVVPRKFFWRHGMSNTDQLQDAYREGNWKYLSNKEGEFLFDLKNDPEEQINLKHTKPDKFDQLKSAFKELDNQMLDRLIAAKE